jgi:hypothetical protein
MLKIRGMSIVENFLKVVNRFGHGLTDIRLKYLYYDIILPPSIKW